MPSAGGRRAQDYPRTGGVVVPPELAQFCDGIVVPSRLPAQQNEAGAELAASAARAVVQRMARPSHALPRSLLNLRLPSPVIVRQTYAVDDRTARVLEHAAPTAKTTWWTLADYLALPRFGPFCLVDLLAARAEAAMQPPPGGAAPAATPPGASPGLAVPLDELATLLMRAMPLGGAQVARLVARDGAAPTLRELARAYRNAGRAVPFRVVRHGGCELIVAPSVRSIARTILVAATQLVSWRGLTTVQQIVTRARLRAACSISAAFAARLLASFPRIVWLDQRNEWFSFRGNDSALLRALRDRLAATDRVELPSLDRALAREKASLARLPAGVWERYLSAVAGCTIEGIWVGLHASGDAPCSA